MRYTRNSSCVSDFSWYTHHHHECSQFSAHKISCWNNPHAIVSDQAVFNYSGRLTRCSAFSVTVPSLSLHQSLEKTAALWITSTFRKETVSCISSLNCNRNPAIWVLMLRTGSPNVGCLPSETVSENKIPGVYSNCRRTIIFLLAWETEHQRWLQELHLRCTDLACKPFSQANKKIYRSPTG